MGIRRKKKFLEMLSVVCVLVWDINVRYVCVPVLVYTVWREVEPSIICVRVMFTFHIGV